MRLALGATAGMVWAAGIVAWWLFPAARAHLASGSLGAALFAASAAWMYGGIYLSLLAAVYPWLPRPRWLTVPASWVLFEVARTHAAGGAPWGLLGHSQHGSLTVAQLAELTGVGGVSFLVLMPAAALAERGRARVHGLVAWLLAMLCVTAFGAQRLAAIAPRDPIDGDAPTLVVVGGHNLEADSLGAYRRATLAAAPGTVTIWPESAIPGYLQDSARDQAIVREAAHARGWLLVGARRYEGDVAARRYLNSAVLFDATGVPRAIYDKSRLVPFAERSPWPFPSLVEQPYTPGTTAAPLEAGALRLGVLVCWEAVFPDPARQYARRGVDVLVNLTSDRDFGAGIAQQLAFSRFRAIETRRWLVRASGIGPAHLIDPAGRVTEGDRLRVDAASEAPSPALYVRHGDLVAWLAVALLGVAFAARRYERRGVKGCERRDGVAR